MSTSGTTIPTINTRWQTERGLYMGQDQQNQTTDTPPLGWLHLRSLPNDSTSSIPKREESPPNTRSGSMPKYTDPTIAVDAIRLVDEDRNDSYGTPAENLGRIAEMWSAFIGTEITADDVALMMVLLKISRSKAGYSRDNAVDGVAYFLIHDSLARYK